MTTSGTVGQRLVADLGGTNARVAVVSDGVLDTGRVMERPVGSVAEARDLFKECLRQAGVVGEIEAAIAAAGPVAGDRITLTNGGWSFSAAELKRDLRFSSISVFNDFVGVAMGVPYLERRDLRAVGDGAAEAEGPIAVVGAGTGLGVAILVPSEGGSLVLPGEGGHATMSPADACEGQILDFLRDDGLRADGEQWWGHVSAERVLSGPGLVNLYHSLYRRHGGSSPARRPREITELAAAGDELALKAIDLFCAMLGTFAGNIALIVGATGGVYIGGGVVPRFTDLFCSSRFRSQFERKGRFEARLRCIPTFLITHSHPALLGLAKVSRSVPGLASRHPVVGKGYRQ